jgi:hypothetical protein
MLVNNYQDTELLHRKLCLVTFYFAIFIHNIIKIVHIVKHKPSTSVHYVAIDYNPEEGSLSLLCLLVTTFLIVTLQFV